MANLEKLIQDKTAADDQWKKTRQAERDNTAAMRDAGIEEITTRPEAYARYLELQGDNPTYSAGNIALVMFGMEGATQIGTRDRWRALGRRVKEDEMENGVKIFARAPQPAKGYILTDAYDISQTQGKPVKEIGLRDDSPQMEAALSTLLNYSPVPIQTDRTLDAPAFYDEANLTLYVNPDFPDSEAFPAIAAEVAQARLHNKGFNKFYSREESKLDAESVSFILCRHFHIPRERPDTSQVAQLYEGWETAERTEALDKIHDMSKKIGRSIENSIAPERQRGRSQPSRAVR